MRKTKHITSYNKLEEESKDLDLLFKIDDILSHHHHDLENVFSELCDILPKAFRYKKYCEVKLKFESVEVKTDNFILNNFKIVEKFDSENGSKGELVVIYRGLSNMEKGIFTPKEKQLLKTVANKLSSFIVQKHLRETINQLKKDKEVAVDNVDRDIREWLQNQGLTTDEVNNILKVKINFSKGETLCKQGAMASYVILLTSGLAKNFVEGNTDKAFSFKIIKPFDFIGMSAVYGRNTYHFSAAAFNNCEAYLIDTALIKNIIDTNKVFAKTVNTWYCEIIQSHLDRMSSIANKQSLGRLAETLIYLSEDIFEDEKIKNTISRKEIAALAAMSTESAVRFMSDLKKDKILEITSKEIIIKNPKVLKLISRS